MVNDNTIFLVVVLKNSDRDLVHVAINFIREMSRIVNSYLVPVLGADGLSASRNSQINAFDVRMGGQEVQNY